MISFYEKYPNIDVEVMTDKFLESYGYFPKLDPCCFLKNGEANPECVIDVECDREDFLQFIQEPK